MNPKKRIVLCASKHVIPIPNYMKQTAHNENLERHLITDPHFKGPRTPIYGKMNLSEQRLVSELKWAVTYLANQSGWMQNLISTSENKILKSPWDGVFFILNLTECYQLMKYKQCNAKGTIDAENLLSELCHCGCLLCKTLHQRSSVVPKWVDSCSSSASFPFP